MNEGIVSGLEALVAARPLSGAIVYVDPGEDGRDDAIYGGRGCGGESVPLIRLGGNRPEQSLWVSFAHELGHHAQSQRGRFVSAHIWKTAFGVALVAAYLTVLLPAPPRWLIWTVAVSGVVAAAAKLASLAFLRASEYDADRYAVCLLDAAGLPGRTLVLGMLDRELRLRPDGWMVWFSPFLTHPTLGRRMARIRSMNH